MIRAIFLVILLLNLVVLSAQDDSFITFKKTVYAASHSNLDSIFESRLNHLKIETESTEDIFLTLNFQKEVADSLKIKSLGNTAAFEIINYPEFQKPEELFENLLKAGNYQIKLGNYDTGAEIHFDALEIAENLKNDTLVAKIKFRLGISFMKADNIQLSQKYLCSAIELNKKINDSLKLSGAYMSYGNSFKNSGVYDSALYYYNISLELAKLINSDRNKAGNYNNMGNVYRLQKQYAKAIDFYENAARMNISSDNKTWLSYNYNNLGLTYKIMRNYQKALWYYQESLKIKDLLKDYSSKVSTLVNISELYALKGSYKKAYEKYAESEALSEEYANEEKLNLTANIEAKFRNEKKENLVKQMQAEQRLRKMTLATQKKKLALQNEVKEGKQILMIILIVIIVSLIFSVILFWRNSLQKKEYVRTLHKKNNQIRTVNSDLKKAQKVLTKKNDEITDSITYAKRIQAAILPSQKVIRSALENAFILYLPKDIVAGDFYWTEQSDNKVLFAVADCTGHGVPGAMVSVICNSALNASIKNEGLTDPGQILDHTTEIVLSQFSKSEEEVKDGMDIALCSFDSKTNMLEYAGANIPLWLVRNNEVIEVKATRQPIGKYVIRQPFKTNQIEIHNNDIVYLSSDGYADQFGGEKNKKFMKKNFKKLLLSMSEKNLSQQNKILGTVFVDWKNENEQVDDICVMGIRFTF